MSILITILFVVWNMFWTLFALYSFLEKNNDKMAALGLALSPFPGWIIGFILLLLKLIEILYEAINK